MMLRQLITEFNLMFIPSERNEYMPGFLKGKILFWFIIGLLLLKIVAIPFFIYLPENKFFADITRNSLINLVNEERQFLGLGTLEEDSKLNQAAYLKARDMMEKDYFDHTSANGNTPWYWLRQVGYNYSTAGENLAMGFLESEEVHQAWLRSSTHKDNLLNPKYREVGIAVLRGNFNGSETTIVVQLFGTEKSSAKPVTSNINNDSPTVDDDIAPKVIKVSNPPKTLSFNFVKFASNDYYNLIETVSYALLILVLFAFIINVFVKISIQDKGLILRSVVLLLLIIVSIYVDKEVVIRSIPHSLFIY